MAQLPQWTLPSNSGREQAVWVVTSTKDSAEGKIYTCRVTLEGKFFEATLASEELGPAQDFALTIHGLQLRETVLLRLQEQLQSWLALPLAQLRDRELELDCGVGGYHDQALRLRFGQRVGIISEGKPVATLEYVIGRMRGEISFTVDPSGLQIMSDQLSEVLAQEPDTRDL